MEFGTVELYHNGDLEQKIVKTNVSPAETLVLQALHGDDAIASVSKTTNANDDKTSHKDELERLKREYPENIVTNVFPGRGSKLPVKFRDIQDELNETVDMNSDNTNEAV